LETKVYIFEAGAVPAPFSLAQQWVRVGKHCWVRESSMKLGDVTMETKAYSLLQRKKGLKALLAWTIRVLWKVTKINQNN
jgi:hypothetical protein